MDRIRTAAQSRKKKTMKTILQSNAESFRSRSAQWRREAKTTATAAVPAVSPLHPPLIECPDVLRATQRAAIQCAEERDQAQEALRELRNFAYSILFQANGDLSAEQFRGYAAKLAGAALLRTPTGGQEP